MFASLLPPFTNTISTLPLPIPAQIKLPCACWVTRLFVAAPPISGSRSLLVNLLVNFPSSRINGGKIFWGGNRKAVHTLRTEMPAVRRYTDDPAPSFLLASLPPRFGAPGPDSSKAKPRRAHTWDRQWGGRSPAPLCAAPPPRGAPARRARRAAGGGGRPRPWRGSQTAVPHGRARLPGAPAPPCRPGPARGLPGSATARPQARLQRPLGAARAFPPG